MTAFYMFRLMGLTFWGKSRGRPARRAEHPRVAAGDDLAADHPRGPVDLRSGIVARACRSGPGLLSQWLEPVFEQATVLARATEEASFQLFGIDGALIMASVAVAAIGVALAWRLFGAEIGRIRVAAKPERVRSYSARVPFLYRASLNKWWFDELNHLLFIVIGGRVANFLWWFDRRVIDDTVNGLADVTVGAGREPPPGPDRPRPELRAGHRDRADRHGRLVPRDRGPLTMAISSIPILTLVTFLPLSGRSSSRSRRRATPAGLALATALVDVGRSRCCSSSASSPAATAASSSSSSTRRRGSRRSGSSSSSASTGSRSSSSS